MQLPVSNRSFLFAFFVACVTMVAGIRAQAQPAMYGNEWINYSATYYKFKTGAEGVYRLTKQDLDNAGVPAALGSAYRLFRDGRETPLYVTTAGLLSNSDYLEFFASRLDGSLDSTLFANPYWQSDNRISLFSDSATYYLMVDPSVSGLRFASGNNQIPVGATPAPYCWYTSGRYFTKEHVRGRHLVDLQPIFSSLFEEGEGFVDTLSAGIYPLSYSLTTPEPYLSGPDAHLSLSVLRNNYLTNPVGIFLKVSWNGVEVADSSLETDETQKFDLPLPASQVTPNNVLGLQTGSPATTMDLYGLSFVELTYPRTFTVNGLSYFRFSLPAGSAFSYLEFNGFNQGGVAPRLYDLSTKTWYEGDISVSGKTRFGIPASSLKRDLVLIAAGAAMKPVFYRSIQFTDFSQASSQGNYVIIANKKIEAGGAGILNSYKAYRQASQNGGYTVVLADATELYDQFSYGVEMHPLAIQRFLQYAYYNWGTRPQHTLLIGKGIYYPAYRKYWSNPSAYGISGLLPTYGDPGSDVDFVNFLPGRKQATTIGRVSAWNAQEVSDFLNKLSAYESAVKNVLNPTAEQDLWKKRVLHIAGGREAGEQGTFLQTLALGGAVITDTAFGGMLTTIAKNTTVPVDNVNSKTVDSLINSGLAFVCYHGHASSVGFEFNLNTPQQYNSTPRLPHFLALGCDVAQIFTLSTSKTISEQYIFSTSGGSVSMIASDNLQYASFHKVYLPWFYNSISRRHYGKTIGEHYRATYDTIRGNDQTDFTFFQLESLILEGDPATVVPGPPLADYHVSNAGLATQPVNVTTALDSMTLRVVVYNLGRAVRDTVQMKVEHTNPANITSTVTTILVANLYNQDTVYVRIPINKTSDIGLNRYRATIDAANLVSEVSETNNTGTLDVFIFSDNLVPVHPKEFSIVNQPGITLKASTLNVFRGPGAYRMEIDTTALFNSPLKQTTVINSRGGVIKWTPTFPYQSDRVYYWRAAYDSLQGGALQWANSSFIYLANSSPGWNQSHYYQYQRNDLDSIVYGSDRVFRFPQRQTDITVSNAIFSTTGKTPWDDANFIKVTVNETDVQRLGCPPWGGTLQVLVFDSVTTKLWQNSPVGSFGAYPQCLVTRNVYTFEFPIYTKQGRDNARRFITDSIPNGNYVLIRNLINLEAYDSTFVSEWKLDTVVNGPGQSLYHALYQLGFTTIDSFNQTRPFIFFRKKGSNAFPVSQYFGQDRQSRIEYTFTLPSVGSSASMASTIIGPALQWQSIERQINTLDNQPQNDRNELTILGIDTNNVYVPLYQGPFTDTSLAFIDARLYPNIQLLWRVVDTVNRSSAQLRYWRVRYSPAPEAALNPIAHFEYEDSTVAGKTVNLAVAIENLTQVPLDSMLVRYSIVDASGVSRILGARRFRKLTAENDTLQARLSVDPTAFTGRNYLFVEANPDKDQPEQYHPNNLGYLPLFVDADQRNPLLDVTFDGVHILDRDIVSAKPFIKIALRDENKYLALNDTSLLRLSIRYPNDPLSSQRRIPFDGTVCRFVPATTGSGKNEAYIEYKPVFDEDGIYNLSVNGADRSGNVAGSSDYRISFEVVNRSTITNVLNYPNPFSTSTAFVFTLTGATIPTQFKIQILTVTGKVVREITRQELGPIHVGRNITEYKWDGRDQYGQLLGNGVYLYRVITAINGEGIEHRSDMDGNPNNNSVDRFFKNGWGKMYIMR